jgi:hypothetical protein
MATRLYGPYSLRFSRDAEVTRSIDFEHGIDAEIVMRQQMELWSADLDIPWNTLEIFDHARNRVIERWTPDGSVYL